MRKLIVILLLFTTLGVKGITIGASHPYLLMNNTLLDSLKTAAQSDATLQSYVTTVISRATTDKSRAILTYTLSSSRLLPVSVELKRLMFSLCFAYRWTGDASYALAAKNQLIAVCNFPDWHPSHFLDTGEMMAGVAIGYDWLYNYLTTDQRATVETAMNSKGFTPYISLDTSNSWILTTNYNWNPWCNHGAILGSMAMINVYPTPANNVFNIAIESLPYAISTYEPDGVWAEGADYSAISTQTFVYAIDAMNKVLGTNYGLANNSGFQKAGTVLMHLKSPTGRRLYAGDDWTTHRGDDPDWTNFWLGKKFNNELIINHEHKNLETRLSSITPGHVMYYTPVTAADPTNFRDAYFAGLVPYSFYRSSWTDPNALWVGTHGGGGRIPHSHLDIGNFEMEAVGIRWIGDLGYGEFYITSPNYYDYWYQTGGRWEFYRADTRSHNVPMINNKDQLVTSTATITAHQENVAEPYITYNLTSAYSDDANSVSREIKITNSRRAVQVTDIINLKASSTVKWGVLVAGTVSLISGTEATLTKNGYTVRVQVLSPAGATLATAATNEAISEYSNAEFTKLYFNNTYSSGNNTFTVLFTAEDMPITDPPQCSDGIDNDGDGFVDMLDGGCTDIQDDNEYNAPAPTGRTNKPVQKKEKSVVIKGKVIR